MSEQIDDQTSHLCPKPRPSRGLIPTHDLSEIEQIDEQGGSPISSAVTLRTSVEKHYQGESILPRVERRARKRLKQAYPSHRHCHQTRSMAHVARNLVNPQVLWIPERLFSLIDIYIALSVVESTRTYGQIAPYNDLTTSLNETNTDIQFY
jgi:hypothetical protein